MVILTHAQMCRLEKFPDDCKVVTVDRGDPVVERPNARPVRVTTTGRLAAATKDVLEDLEERKSAA